MKPRFFVWTLRQRSVQVVSMLALLVASACAPALTGTPVPPIDTLISTSTAVPNTSLPEVTVPAPTQTLEVQAVATSRGPNLEATDPTSVNMASGQLQLVEFFRFT